MPRALSGRVGAQLICVAGGLRVEDCGKFAWQSAGHSLARASFNQENRIFQTLD
jgi:hypothetical protein